MLLLADLFEQRLKEISQETYRKTRHPLVKDTWDATIRVLHLGDYILFSPSTMKMLDDKLAHFQETAAELSSLHLSQDVDMAHVMDRLNTATLIQFHEPISFPIPIAGLFISNPSKYMSTGKDTLLLMLLQTDGTPSEYTFMIEKDGSYNFDPSHQCTACTRRANGTFELCQRCEFIADTWNKVFALSSIIAGQYLAARRYEEKEETVLHRKRDKNPKKSKTIKMTYHIKTIDATEIIIPVRPPDAQKRADDEHYSWIAAAQEIDPNAVEYREIRTRPFERTYRHPRYINMRGQTQAFGEGITRRQPRLRGRHMTKVTAKAYEKP